MAERPKFYVNGKLIGEVTKIDMTLDLPSVLDHATDSFRRLNEALWREVLDQEFGKT